MDAGVAVASFKTQAFQILKAVKLQHSAVLGNYKLLCLSRNLKRIVHAASPKQWSNRTNILSLQYCRHGMSPLDLNLLVLWFGSRVADFPLLFVSDKLLSIR